MRIVKFQRNKHYALVNELLAQYNWEPWDVELYGKYFYCVFEGDKLVVTGGMYLYDVKVYGRLGLVIANREVEAEVRSKALDLLFSKIFEICEKKKVKCLEYASTNTVMVNKLVKKLGFTRHTNKDADMLYKSFNFGDVSFLNE